VDAAISADYADTLLLAWRGELDFARVIEHAEKLQRHDRAALAAVLYQTWLQRNHSPYDGYAWFNLGVLLADEGDVTAARDAYLHAIERSPRLFQARVNLGLMFERLGQFDEAVTQWRLVEDEARADEADADARTTLIAAFNNLGRLLEIRKQYSSALLALDKSLSLNPAQPDAIHHWVFLRARQCLWPVYRPFAQVTEEAMRAATSALAMIALSDDPEAQLAAARHYTARKLPTPFAPLAPAEGYQHTRLRIGYASSDLCQHPVAMLTAELFELHDRERFEIYTFDWSPEDGSELRQRIIAASDHFLRIDKLDDEAAAQLIRSHEVDILIDLQGQTSGARVAILARRPAPVQITWLGLPATCSLPGVDYVLADRFLIPEASAQYFSEKPLYLPNVYQPSDRRRPVGPALTRAECGLPETGFVFCCFNNNYKYTADLFAVWMRILTRTPGSVLWLLADNPWARANLVHQLDLHHIARERVIFAERATPDVFRARLAVADLFLDTFPFNAGTTANDALWMALPVLTCAGRSFASRMAGALLTAAGLDELITTNFADYEEKAVALAHAPADCQRLHARLGEVKAHGALFDTPRFVRDLEGVLTGVVPRACAIEALRQERNAVFEHELAVVAIVKNEASYIEEWLEYHKLVGVEKFYIYDNESSDNLKTILRPYIDSGEVVYEYAPNLEQPNAFGGVVPQLQVYCDCIEKCRTQTRWLAIIDVDEFIVPLEKETIPELLSSLQATTMQERPFVGLGIHWVIYGYSGHRVRPEGLVIENYSVSAGADKHIKSIVNPRTVTGFTNPHSAVHAYGLCGVDENGKTIDNPPFWDESATENEIRKIRINHYFTKSYAEYSARLQKNRLHHDSAYQQIEAPPFDVTGDAARDAWQRIGSGMVFPDHSDQVMGKFIPEVKAALLARHHAADIAQEEAGVHILTAPPPTFYIPEVALDATTARPRRLTALGAIVGCQSYLEIGVDQGNSFFALDFPRKVAVDPVFKFDITQRSAPGETFHALTSDAYFAGPGQEECFDLIYLDGLHTYAQTLADLEAALAHSHAGSLILIDDTVPSDVFSTVPDMATAFQYRARFGNNPRDGNWHGDVYKVVIHIHDQMPELSYLTFISGGNPQTVVWKEARADVRPFCDDPARIAWLDFFWLQAHYAVLRAAPESEVINHLAKMFSQGALARERLTG
jgi:predicted O-linked N-acetylglucosamine transferase (SPINDLY family)